MFLLSYFHLLFFEFIHYFTLHGIPTVLYPYFSILNGFKYTLIIVVVFSWITRDIVVPKFVLSIQLRWTMYYFFYNFNSYPTFFHILITFPSHPILFSLRLIFTDLTVPMNFLSFPIGT